MDSIPHVFIDKERSAVLTNLGPFIESVRLVVATRLTVGVDQCRITRTPG